MGRENEGVAVTNRWQRLVAVVGLVVALGLALFPPWQVGTETFGVTYSGRAWWWTAKLMPIAPSISGCCEPVYARIIWSRLTLEQGIVWGPTITLILLFRKHPPAE